MRIESVQLVRQAVGTGRRTYVLVNNRAEEDAPLTVQGMGGYYAARCPCAADLPQRIHTWLPVEWPRSSHSNSRFKC